MILVRQGLFRRNGSSAISSVISNLDIGADTLKLLNQERFERDNSGMSDRSNASILRMMQDPYLRQLSGSSKKSSFGDAIAMAIGDPEIARGVFGKFIDYTIPSVLVIHE